MPKAKDKKQELLDELLKDAKTADDLFAKGGLFQQLKKAALERMLEAEMTEHLGYEKHAPEGYDGANSRNGHGSKQLITDDGSVELEVPRDREGTFEPKVVKKGQRRLPGFDDQIIALYSRGMTVREIQAHVKDMYDTDVSPDFISRVTDQVLDEVREWQARPLDEVYPIVFLDGFVLKIREDRVVQNRTVYVALGINVLGHKDVLGLWVAQTEGAKFWMHVATELRGRGLQDILIACCDGLKGFPEAIEAVFPKAIVQTCVVHMIRNSTHLVAWNNRKAVARDLRQVYAAPTEEAALDALTRFETAWGRQYPSIGRSWRTHWARVSPFFGFPSEIRKVVYTTNVIESMNALLRKATKVRGSLPTEDAALKLLWLTIDRTSRKWTFPIKGWDLVVQQLGILFGERMPVDAYSH
jgi:putative transposase